LWRQWKYFESQGKGTYTESRELEPQDEHGLESVVPGEVVEENADSEALEEVEETEDNPVGEPLDVISVAGRFEGLDRKVRRQNPTEKVGDRGCETVESMKNEEQSDTTEEGISLGNLRLLLDGI
jgi:hypothetical protein